MTNKKYEEMLLSQKIIKRIYFDEFKQILKNNDIDNILCEDLEKFLFAGTPTFRSFYIKKVHDLVNNSKIKDLELTKSKDNWMRIMLLIEIEVFVHYKYNQIFDRKYGITSRKKIIQNIIKAFLLKTSLNSYITVKFKQSSSLIFPTELFLRGEYIDLFRLNIIDFEKTSPVLKPHLSKDEIKIISQIQGKFIKQIKIGINVEDVNLIEIYLYRCFFINSNLLKFYTNVLIKNHNDEKNKKIIEVTIIFGILAQIMNDLIDYLPPQKSFGTKTKFKDDSFLDFQNGIFTFPLIIAKIFYPEDKHIQYILDLHKKITVEDNYRLSENEIDRIILLLINLNIFQLSFDIFTTLTKEIFIEMKQTGIFTEDFLDIWSVLLDNKYVRELTKLTKKNKS